MMRSFGARLMVRVAALFALLVVLAYLVTSTRLYAVTVVVGALAAIQAALVVRYADRTNRELARLLTAIRHDDFSQGFAISHLGQSFAELAASFAEVTKQFRVTRMENEGHRRYLETLVEHVPVAIVAVADGGTEGGAKGGTRSGTVRLLNSAARRLLDASADTTLDGLHRYGASFQRDMAQSKSGHRSLTRTELDGVQRHLVLSTTQLWAGGENLRLITLQDIQSELDSNELAAWQDMARVLTHEIMNSLTPIASLARTADEMVAELADKGAAGGAGAATSAAASAMHDELIGDLRAAVSTLAKRSDSLMRFVRNYRELTQMPPPVMTQLALPDYLRRVSHLFSAEWANRGVTLQVAPPAEGLVLVADEALLDQALINVLRNAAAAALGNDRPTVWLEARRSDRGRPVLEISDNGAGLDEEIGEKIFLPFFTTKADGSGIGLALARQVMLVHQGAITAGPRPGGGARFRLTF